MTESIIVTAYPKSGSTWLCRILGDALNSPVDGVADAVPLAKEGQDRTGDYTIFQTHLAATHCGKQHSLVPDRWQFNLDQWTTQKVIHLVRDPRAIAVSAKHYWEIPSVDETLDAMFHAGSPIEFEYNSFVGDWLGTKAHLIRYEDLLRDPELELALFFKKYRIPYSIRRLQRAIERQSFAIRKKELDASGDKYPYSNGIQSHNLRKGIADDWKLYFTAGLKAKAQVYFGDIMTRLDYPMTPDGWDAAKTILNIIFPDQPEPSLRKAQVLYELSRQAKDGDLVECGVAQGRGVIAMALGSRDGNDCPVVAVDDYEPHQDWANNSYDRDNLAVLLRNVSHANVEITVQCQDAVTAGVSQDRPVAMWCWDVSTNAEDLWQAWLAWEPHIQDGGIAFIRDLYDKRFDSDRVKEDALTKGFVVEMEELGILLLKKK